MMSDHMMLNMSRSLGDPDFKGERNLVESAPEVCAPHTCSLFTITLLLQNCSLHLDGICSARGAALQRDACRSIKM